MLQWGAGHPDCFNKSHPSPNLDVWAQIWVQRSFLQFSGKKAQMVGCMHVSMVDRKQKKRIEESYDIQWEEGNSEKGNVEIKSKLKYIKEAVVWMRNTIWSTLLEIIAILKWNTGNDLMCFLYCRGMNVHLFWLILQLPYDSVARPFLIWNGI